MEINPKQEGTQKHTSPPLTPSLNHPSIVWYGVVFVCRVQLASAQTEVGRLKEAADRTALEKRTQEQSLDDLESKCRAALSAEEDARYDGLCKVICYISIRNVFESCGNDQLWKIGFLQMPRVPSPSSRLY